MRVSPQAEWGESPRESVTVMRPWGDKSGQLRAMQGLCHNRSRRNTSCQVYCIRAVHWLHGFFVCSGRYWEPAAASYRVSAALLLFGSQDLCTSPLCRPAATTHGACRLGTGRRLAASLWGSDTPLELRSYEICIKNVRFHILDRENSGRRKRNESICNVGAGSGRLDRKAAAGVRAAGRDRPSDRRFAVYERRPHGV